MYALSNISPGCPVWSVYARTESNGSRMEETPRNKSNLNPKITQRAKNKIQKSGIRGPATRVLNSKARVIHSVGLPLAGSRGDTAFHDTATAIADSRIIDCGNGSCTSSECNDDYSSIFTRLGR